MESTSLDLALASGSLHALRSGPEEGARVLCVPGLSAHARSFDLLAARLAAGGRRVVALDLRGRGRSPATAPGTYGWKRHAEDVLEAASKLGWTSFDLAGHSMGAFVSLQAAALAPGRIRRLVLIDGVGPPEPAVVPPLLAGIERLGRLYASAQEYGESIRRHGAAVPWHELWERHYFDELDDVPGGVRPRTSKEAVVEDAVYGGTHDARELWPLLRMPTLLVRAARPLLPGTGFVVGTALREAFLAAVPVAQVAEVDANHYGVMAHGDALRAVERFLAQAVKWPRRTP